MNPLQVINSAASFAIFSALIAGLIRMFDVENEIPWSIVIYKLDTFLLIVFIVLFRIKMHFDDHRYFAAVARNINRFTYTEVVLAILTWISMAVSAGTVGRPKISAWFLLVSILLSSAWLFAHLTQLASKKRSGSEPTMRERLSWGLFNMIYCLALVSYVMAGSIGTGLFHNYSTVLHSTILIFMIVALIIEEVYSRNYIQFLGE